MYLVLFNGSWLKTELVLEDDEVGDVGDVADVKKLRDVRLRQ